MAGCFGGNRKGTILPFRSLVLVTLMTLGAGSLLADNFNWGGTYVANWDNFGTSPYTAIDTSKSPNQTITIFCLDFNDEIAPPESWTASIIPLSQPNVTNSGAYQNVYTAQYGGSYNSLVTAAFNNPSDPKAAGETKAPQVSGPPFVFNKDSAGTYNVDLTNDDAYTRYLEAAWLFTDIEQAIAQHPQDTNTDMIAQAAAWELFVNSSNLSALTGDVKTYGGTYTFNNYLSLSSGDYTTNPGVTTLAASGLTFEEAVDAALVAAQNAVDTLKWGPGSYNYGTWNIVTGTPAYVVGYGRPVQEFLSPNGSPDSPPSHDSPVPEPKAIFLLGTVAAFVLWTRRSRRIA